MEATKIIKIEETKISFLEAEKVINKARDAFFETEVVNRDCDFYIEDIEIYDKYVRFCISYISRFENYDYSVNDWDVIREKEIFRFRFLDKRGEKIAFEEMEDEVYQNFCETIKTNY